MSRFSTLIHTAFSPLNQMEMGRNPSIERKPADAEVETQALALLARPLLVLKQLGWPKRIRSDQIALFYDNSEALLELVTQRPRLLPLQLIWARLFREFSEEMLADWGITFEHTSQATHAGSEKTTSRIIPVEFRGHNGFPPVGTACEYAYLKHCFGVAERDYLPIVTTWVEVGDEVHQTHQIQVGGSEQTIWFHSAAYSAISRKSFPLLGSYGFRRPACLSYEDSRIFAAKDEARTEAHLQHVIQFLQAWHGQTSRLRFNE